MQRLLLVVLLLLVGCKQDSPAPAPAASASAVAVLAPLDARFEPLVGAFNASAERVRVLALLSPT